MWNKLNNSANTQLICCDELTQEIIAIDLSGQPLLNAGRGSAKFSQNND